MGEHRWKNDYSANDRLGWSTLADFAQHPFAKDRRNYRMEWKNDGGKKKNGKVQEENWKEGRT